MQKNKKIKYILIVLFLSVTLQAEKIEVTGTVVSNGQQMIGSRYMGYVKKVFVNLGDKVKREDDLYEMESAEFDLMKSQADLMLEQSKIVVEYWRNKLSTVKRKRNRFKTDKTFRNNMKFMNVSDFDDEVANINTMLEAMQVMVKEANIKAKQISSTYNYLKMKAPSDGVVVQKNIKVGDMIMPGMLTIMIVDIENLEVEISVPETVLGKVKEGHSVQVRIPSIKYQTKGFIHAIVPDVNPMTHKIKMRIKFDKGEQNIFPGMYAKVIL